MVERSCSFSLSLFVQCGVYPALLAKNTQKKDIISFLFSSQKIPIFQMVTNIIPEFSPCPISSENAKDLQESCPRALVWDEKAEEKVFKNYSRSSGGREVLKGQERIPLLGPN